jgi:predicted DNA-binding protein (MmcQ/YjbR family)
MAGSARMQKNFEKLREFAVGLPGAWEDFPWEERVVKVGKKIFAFLGHDAQSDNDRSLGVKLPESSAAALSLPHIEPSGYGLGKAGWVTVRYGRRGAPPVDALLEWIEESYRAIAPKKLSAQLDSTTGD